MRYSLRSVPVDDVVCGGLVRELRLGGVELSVAVGLPLVLPVVLQEKIRYRKAEYIWTCNI